MAAVDAHQVLALDADPQMNLPWALGLADEQARALTPLSANADYVEEKTGARPGEGWGLFVRLNPNVDDVVERFGVMAPDRVRLIDADRPPAVVSADVIASLERHFAADDAWSRTTAAGARCTDG